MKSCSLQGYCVRDPTTMQYSCACVDFKTGFDCNSDLRPCFSSPCLNMGVCTDFSNQTQLNATRNNYTCECIHPYYGSQCQNKINICENVNCSGNGLCQDMGNSTKCKCFMGFIGDKCETETAKLKTIKNIISTTTIVAYLTLGVFLLMVLCIDYTSYRQGKFKPIEQKRTNVSKKYRKPVYVNWPK